MIDISKLSRCYSVRILEQSDVDMIREICEQNIIFYKYTEARPTRENILNDMQATPPGIDLSAKYYFGFFDDQQMVAIMDFRGRCQRMDEIGGRKETDLTKRARNVGC